MTSAEIISVLGLASPLLLIVIGAWLKRRADQAITEKTQADTLISEATADKVRAETDSLFLQNAVRLVDEFKKQQAERNEMYAEKIATSREKIVNLEGRIIRMEEGFSRLRAALATHGVWDATALVDLREIKPDYPSPPRLPDNLDFPPETR